MDDGVIAMRFGEERQDVGDRLERRLSATTRGQTFVIDVRLQPRQRLLVRRRAHD
jgi:hypothetical protein